MSIQLFKDAVRPVRGTYYVPAAPAKSRPRELLGASPASEWPVRNWKF